MQLIQYPTPATWTKLLERPHIDSQDLSAIVEGVLKRIRTEGDKAVRDYELQFDKVALTDLQVSEAEMQEAEQVVSTALKQAIGTAKANIATFHAAQKHTLPKVETTKGVTCWQKAMPIEKVGLYVPGGTAPLFSTVLMLAIPAQIAGCQEIVLCTPPNDKGKINPVILYAAKIAGVSKIFKIGGIQAIGAMAYGTESVPKVYKIFGPGNQYVMAAKQQVSLHDVAIDMPAGPSEVAIIADETAPAASVAADMLSQAEHGKDSQSVVFTTSIQLAQASPPADTSRSCRVLPKYLAISGRTASFVKQGLVCPAITIRSSRRVAARRCSLVKRIFLGAQRWHSPQKRHLPISSDRGAMVMAFVGHIAAARSRSLLSSVTVSSGKPRNSSVRVTLSRLGIYCQP